MVEKNKQDKKIKCTLMDNVVVFVIVPIMLIFLGWTLYTGFMDVYERYSVKKQILNEYINHHNLNSNEYANAGKDINLAPQYSVYYYLYGIRFAESINIRDFYNYGYNYNVYDFFRSIYVPSSGSESHSVLVNDNKLPLNYYEILEDYICNTGVIKDFYNNRYGEKVEGVKYSGIKCIVSFDNDQYKELKKEDAKRILAELFYVYFDISSQFDKYKEQIELRKTYGS